MRMTLEDAIQQIIDQGEKDPSSVAQAVIASHDKDWIGGQLAEMADEILVDYARRHLNANRRSAEGGLARKSEAATAVLKVRRVWVPENGWKRYEDITAVDLRARAEWYRRFAKASLRRAAWCDDVAELLDSQKARTIGDLSVPVPPLPDDGAPDALAA